MNCRIDYYFTTGVVKSTAEIDKKLTKFIFYQELEKWVDAPGGASQVHKLCKPDPDKIWIKVYGDQKRKIAVPYPPNG